MSSISSELNALATTSVVDIYRRSIVRNKPDRHYLSSSRWFTVLWGVLALSFATFASLVENLIEAVNIVGSIFYGVILGRSEEHTSEPQSLMRISYAVFCLKK